MSTNNLVIDVKGLYKSFGGKPAVSDVALQVEKGDIFGFLGPNGSGKTTTIRMLCGLLTPDKAQGTCLGFDIVKDFYHIKKRVGYMTQHFSLYKDLSIRENLDFMARMYKVKNRSQKVDKSIEDLGLADRQNQLAGTLSGGWKQRLSLSATLIHEPQLLLLDEPTAGVDPKARREFWAQIQKLSAQGVTTLVSTHYMDEAERCTKLAYIFHGHILTQGTEQEVIAKANLFTWQITGTGKLTTLMENLKTAPGVTQTAIFGKKLHVSGKNVTVLQDTISQLNTNSWQTQKIEPSLEEIFVDLCGKEHI
jgi:ABC-2 type transport system ATP-binding protein